MDPLAILGGFGELANALLSDFEPIGNRELAADQIFQGIEVFDHQRRHMFSSLRGRLGLTSVQQHVCNQGCAQLFSFRIGEVDASHTEG